MEWDYIGNPLHCIAFQNMGFLKPPNKDSNADYKRMTLWNDSDRNGETGSVMLIGWSPVTDVRVTCIIHAHVHMT